MLSAPAEAPAARARAVNETATREKQRVQATAPTATDTPHGP